MAMGSGSKKKNLGTQAPQFLWNIFPLIDLPLHSHSFKGFIHSYPLVVHDPVKALLHSYTMLLARQHPELLVSCLSPGRAQMETKHTVLVRCSVRSTGSSQVNLAQRVRTKNSFYFDSVNLHLLAVPQDG